MSATWPVPFLAPTGLASVVNDRIGQFGQLPPLVAMVKYVSHTHTHSHSHVLRLDPCDADPCDHALQQMGEND